MADVFLITFVVRQRWRAATEGKRDLPQHKKITLQRAEALARRFQDRYGTDGGFSDVLRVLVAVDTTLVKHEHTDIARRLRQAFDRVEDEV